MLLIVSEADFPKFVPPHEPTLIDKAVHASDSTLRRVLPHRDVAVVLQSRLVVGILRNHHEIIVEFAQQMLVVEIRAGIDERFLLVFGFDKFEKLEKRVAELLRRKFGRRFHIDHRNQILLLRTTLRTKILQLQALVGDSAIEMIRPDLKSLTMSESDVLLELGVDSVAAFCRLQINVCAAAVLPDSLPENIALIVAQVDAVNVLACVLALHLRVENRSRKQYGEKYQNSFHDCKGTNF